VIVSASANISDTSHATKLTDPGYSTRLTSCASRGVCGDKGPAGAQSGRSDDGSGPNSSVFEAPAARVHGSKQDVTLQLFSSS